MELTELRRAIALGCRILAATGATTPLLGHVSMRLDDGRVLMRCRGPHERGLLFTTVDDIRVVGLDDSGDVGGGYRLPHEFPIHAELLRARPDISSVVHAHPPHTLVAALAEVPLRPVFGAYDIPAFRLAAEGVPVHRFTGLVRTAQSGRDLAATLGSAAVCVLLGHGVVSVGGGPVESVLRTLALDDLARVSVGVAALGGRPQDVPAADREELPDLGAELNQQALWRHHVGLLQLRGLDEVG
jgi:ribulose-5-phosphate 4-epimerase/fuculose-1-phosphate aldolase